MWYVWKDAHAFQKGGSCAEELYEAARASLKIQSDRANAAMGLYLNPNIQKGTVSITTHMREGPSGVGLAILKPPSMRKSLSTMLLLYLASLCGILASTLLD